MSVETIQRLVEVNLVAAIELTRDLLCVSAARYPLRRIKLMRP
jgi:hypothetical protein